MVFRNTIYYFIWWAFIPDAKIHVLCSGGGGGGPSPDFFTGYGIFGLGGIGELELMGGLVVLK